jgi:acetyl-CoA acetyltransferase
VAERASELRLQRCNACGKVYSPPRPFCPACAARDVAVIAASGKGRLYSYGSMGPPTLFPIPALRYVKTYGLTHEQLAMVSVVQREWAGKNPRATFRTPITVEDVLNSRMIAYPLRFCSVAS